MDFLYHCQGNIFRIRGRDGNFKVSINFRDFFLYITFFTDYISEMCDIQFETYLITIIFRGILWFIVF